MYLIYSGVFYRLRRHYFAKLLKKCNLGQDAVLLDYGCGPGDLLMVAESLGVKAVGVDAFPRSVDLAQARGLNAFLGDAESLDYPARHFDVIVMQSVIEHLDAPLEVMGHLVKLLKPGGVLIVSAPTPGADFWNDPTHVRPYTPQSMYTIGELLGMRVENVSYVFSFLLGFALSHSLIYKILNLFSFALGSNLVAFYKK